MLFNSALYGAFLLATFLVFWLVRTHRVARGLFLVVASYGFYFYGTWETAKAQSVPLRANGWSILRLAIYLLGNTLDYLIERTLGKTDAPRKRKELLLR